MEGTGSDGRGRGELRREQFLRGIDIATQRGLEIGALHRPTVKRSDGSIHYADFTTTAELRRLYSTVASVDVSAIEDVDFVWAQGHRLSDIVLGAKFDYVLASHVLEHVPNLVSWFMQLDECLVPGGIVSLIIPDKRFTFDRDRDPSSWGEVFGAYIDGSHRPTSAQIFNHLAYHTRIDDLSRAWAHPSGKRDFTRVHTCREALDMAKIVRATGEYFDVHCTICTPESFLGLLQAMAETELLPFLVEEVVPTTSGEIDFFVTLRKPTTGVSHEDKLALQQEAFETAMSSVRGSTSAI